MNEEAELTVAPELDDSTSSSIVDSQSAFRLISVVLKFLRKFALHLLVLQAAQIDLAHSGCAFDARPCREQTNTNIGKRSRITLLRHFAE